MSSKTIYSVPQRRRREGKTDYRKRIKLVASKRLRFVVRKSNTALQASVVSFTGKGDTVEASAHSQSLKKLGWQFSGNNIPAGYLVGYLAGKKASKKGIKEAVLDLGLYKSVKGSKIYAVVAGAVDAGLSIPHAKDILPAPERLTGKHIGAYANSLQSNQEAYKKQFGKVEKAGPNNIEQAVATVKGAIDKL